MNKPDIAKRLAGKAGWSDAEAADHLDRVLQQILSNLRRGKEASLPGLGKFVSGPDGRIEFQRDGTAK